MNYSDEPETYLTRVKRVMPALILAAALVTGAVAIAKPWQSNVSGNGQQLGIVDQVPASNGEGIEFSTDPLPGELASNFRLESIDGNVIELAELRGKPVFVNFWATWCFSCISEMPAMQRVSDRLGDELVVIGVNVGESRDDAATFAANNDIAYALVLDTDQQVTEEYLVRAMPTSLFIDRDGVVANVRFGAMTEEEMLEHVQPLLGA